MKTVVNRPPAGTFSWLHAGGTEIEVPDEAVEYEYRLAPGEERTVILTDFEGKTGIEAALSEGSQLTLVEIRRGGTEGLSENTICVRCEDRASFHWIRLILSDAEAYDNCQVILSGEGSEFRADIGFFVGGTGRYDLNCEAVHEGKKSTSEIRASGVLSGSAKKLLRGTIDFRKGCSGAVGNESEEVLLLSERVENLSVPVILCAEEDVVGNHGASIGQADEKLLHYFGTRGISEAHAVRMLSEAKLGRVIGQIPDEALQEQLRNEVNHAD